MEYQVVFEDARYLDRFHEHIAHLIRQGWKPQGGVCFTGYTIR